MRLDAVIGELRALRDLLTPVAPDQLDITSIDGEPETIELREPAHESPPKRRRR